MRRAVYAGSFDPLTNGHVDIVLRGARLFDEVVVAVGHNVRKQRMLSLETRLDVLREVLEPVPNVRVDHFEGLLVDYCRRVGAMAILRGLRAVTDFEYELAPGLANRDLAPEIEIVVLFADPRHAFVSSTLVKEIAAHGGPADRYLPPASWRALRAALDRPNP